ncbi:hypothetical protein HZ320_06685 [[Pasteurella] aerogenes]|nr:hypothetical protein HZ320_06685 [[Pasteurella] aerogenes]
MKYSANMLYIEKLRKFVVQGLPLGKKINVFSVQDGIGKSNLLSFIATTFGTKDKPATGGNLFSEFSNDFIIELNENFKKHRSYFKVAIEKTDKFEEYRHEYKNSNNEEIRSDNRYFNENVLIKDKEWYNVILPNSIKDIKGSNQLIHKNVVKNSNLHIELDKAIAET